MKEKRETRLFSVCATVDSGYVEEPTDPRQLTSSPAKGSKVPPRGIYCPPTNDDLQQSNISGLVVTLVLSSAHGDPLPVLTVTKFKPKCRSSAEVGKVYYVLK